MVKNLNFFECRQSKFNLTQSFCCPSLRPFCSAVWGGCTIRSSPFPSYFSLYASTYLHLLDKEPFPSFSCLSSNPKILLFFYTSIFIENYVYLTKLDSPLSSIPTLLRHPPTFLLLFFASLPCPVFSFHSSKA